MAFSRLSAATTLFKWLFWRLPLGFSIPLSALWLIWIFYGFRYTLEGVAGPVQSQIGKLVGWPLLAMNVGVVLYSLAVILLFFAGLLAAYNVAAWINLQLLRRKLKPRGDTSPPSGTSSTGSTSPRNSPGAALNVGKIGIVLAGGGAKGAFQAGAMKAIYRFLEENNVLANVTAIAGTSIGSWNALFWLAGLIKPGSTWDGESVHEAWWRAISARSLTAPSWYVPFFRNAFLTTEPWQMMFDQIFSQPGPRQRLLDSKIHFYLTRANVRSAELECVTNNPDPRRLANVKFEHLDSASGNAYLAGLKQAVFASMDLPPLFPYVRRDHELFEDGGVIDNLPITFAAMEKEVDLIFVLPLNADFEEEPNETSILARLYRVMDVRQGALERAGFKVLYLYNELAALRDASSKLGLKEDDALGSDDPLNVALRRGHRRIDVFAICPARSFVQSTLNTQEFWKAQEAGIAFDVMHDTTATLLNGTHFGKKSNVIRVALVSRGGNVCWDEEF